jgi:outer membrane protein TolC
MDTQHRSERLLSFLENLVKAGSLEPAALNQARANLLSNRVDVRGQQERLNANLQELAVIMGLSPLELPHAPSPVGTFPPVISPDRLEAIDVKSYIASALRQRGDYLGAQVDMETAAILIRQAQNQSRPKLDLGINAGHAAINNDSNANHRDVNYILLSLNLELPIQNNTARGNLSYRQSQARSSKLALTGLENRIASETLVAYEALLAAAQANQLAEQAEAAYRKAVDFENQKYKSGRSTLTAVIDTEGRYFTARATRIEVLRRYATALANFRFVTGSLLDHREEGLEQFDINRLLEFPATDVNT